MGAKADVDQRAIEELVEHYGAKGRAVGRLGIAVGAIAGVLVGAVPLSPLSFAWPIPSSFGLATVLLGLGIGLLLGFVIGDSRARMYHRMAEQARAQLVLEERISKSDARIAQLVAALTARARASAAQAAPVVAPQPPVPQPVTPQPPVAQPVVPQPVVTQPVPPVQPPAAPPTLPPVAPPDAPQIRAVAAAPPPPALSVLPPPPAVEASPEPEPVTAEPEQQVAASAGTPLLAAPPLSPPVSG